MKEHIDAAEKIGKYIYDKFNKKTLKELKVLENKNIKLTRAQSFTIAALALQASTANILANIYKSNKHHATCDFSVKFFDSLKILFDELAKDKF